MTCEGDDFSNYIYQYDSLGRQTTVNSANRDQPTVLLTNGYDASGSDAVSDDLRTSLSANIGGTADFANTYSYDFDGNLRQVVQAGEVHGNAVTEKQVDFNYNNDDQVMSIDRYQGDTSHLVACSTYTYDDQGDVIILTDTAPDSGTENLPAYTWDYDADGRVSDEYSLADTSGDYNVSVPTSWAHTHYTYNASGELTGASYSSNFKNAPADENYTFDANGNQTRNGQQVGTDNELQSDGTYFYTYDADGNCTSRTRMCYAPSSDYTTLYTWDNRNRLTEVKNENIAGQVTSDMQYTYDVENRLIGETVTTYSTPGDASTATTTQQEFVYDGNQIVLQFSGTTAGAVGTQALGNSDLSERYLWGPAVDQLFAQEATTPATEGQTTLNAGAVDWALTDNLGTVRDMAVYNPTTGVTSVAMHRVYDSVRQPGESDQSIGRVGSGGGLPVRLHRLPVQHGDGFAVQRQPLVRSGDAALAEPGSLGARSGLEPVPLLRQCADGRDGPERAGAV